MDDLQPITREGYEKKKAEIKYLEDEVMPQIAENIAAAREEGDLKENTEYHGQREEQGRVAAKIGQLKAALNNCKIVQKSEMPKGEVTFGSTVTILDLDMEEEETYEFVGMGEENYDGPVMKILTTSPIAEALMGLKEGDTVEIELPRTTMNVKVVKIIDHE